MCSEQRPGASLRGRARRASWIQYSYSWRRPVISEVLEIVIADEHEIIERLIAFQHQIDGAVGAQFEFAVDHLGVHEIDHEIGRASCREKCRARGCAYE